MSVPEGFFVIHQPKHKIPGVFDLHERGLFKTRPYVTKEYAYRVIANGNLSAKLQFLCLKEEAVNDPTTGERYRFFVEKTLIDLDEELKLKSADLATHVANQSILDEILAAHDEWRNAYIPLKKKKKTDKEGLKKKLLTSIAERKEVIRKELVRKNSSWVNAAMPRLIQDFQRGLYLLVEERLYEQYRQMGGTEAEKELIKRINLFQRVYDCDKKDPMRKPNGRTWKSEDEIWECWIGFAGSEEEAIRVCRTMEAVFRPLVEEMAQQKAETRP
jgi:hypothetical protein